MTRLAERAPRLSEGAEGFDWDASGALTVTSLGLARLIIDVAAPCHYRLNREASPEALRLLNLFVPLCTGGGSESLVVGHIAQSLDGRIATKTGESQFISGPEDLVHTHRLRAISDAVVVGVRTAICDDPLLTTRLVEGHSPVRVILDPRGILPKTARVLQASEVPTLLVTGSRDSFSASPHVEVMKVELSAGRLDLKQILAALRQRGLRRVFVEGGGVTISRFLEASLLSRLHVAIAPAILGSGPLSIELPPIAHLSEHRQVKWASYQLGRDLLLDCQFPARLPEAPV